ncbi:cytochrome c biogenesis protein CcdA [Psychrobacter lutiphocae]|uniref:cytochrome c biogenesis protein CcdA n=1 Tax=Psychrobacter lutiphocae TaxID=540500 RepID=UPI000372617D|nr:protein-disulfide reductase DsbD domain-containing protein [Psychrobacter lutiphocae]
MKNVITVPNSFKDHAIPSAQQTQATAQLQTSCKTRFMRCNDSKPISQVLLTAFFAVAITVAGSFTQSNQAQAASLADLFGGSNSTSSAQQKFLKVEDAFSVKPVQNGNRIEVSLNITPKHYLYKDKLTLKLPDGVSASDFQFSHASESIDDPTFGKVDVFRQPKVTATALLTNSSDQPINQDVSLTWQGCADAGLCYPPQTEILAVSLPAAVSATEQSTAKASATSASTARDSEKQAQSQQAVANASANTQSKTTAPQINSQLSTKTTVTEHTRTDVSDTTASEAGDTTNATDADMQGVIDASTDAGLDGDAGLVGNLAVQSQSPVSEMQANQGSLFSNTGVVNEDPFGLAEHPWLALLLLFLAGLGLAFTPCVLPMLPIVSNIVARQHTPTAKKGLMLSGSYAVGVAVAYGLLGAVIAVFGQQLGIIGWLQNPVILLSFAVVFVLLALYMLDVIRVPVPNNLRQKSQALSQAGDKYLGSSSGSFVAGLLSALVVSPCVSAPLFGALLAVSTIGNPLLGFAALFMLGFGLSAPLILLGIGQSNLMPKAGEWMVWVKQGFALLLFAVALLLIERVLFSSVMLMLWSVWFMVLAIWAWRWQGRGQLFTKPMAVVLAIWSGLTLIGAAAGSQDSWQPLRIFTQRSAPLIPQQTIPTNTERTNGLATSNSNMASSFSNEGAADLHLVTLESLIPVIENNDKVLIDLTAEWCVECRIMDKTLFTNRPQALHQWQMVRLDITETNEDSARILSELRLFGPPALLYFVDGKLVEQQVGIIKRDEFEATLARLAL